MINTQLSLPLDPLEEPELTAERLRLANSVKAPRTLLGYASDWKFFTAFSHEHERSALPASSATVALYITDLLNRGHKVTTATRHVSSIAHQHRTSGLASPCDASIRSLLTGARRLRCEQPAQKDAITVEQLGQMCLHLNPETPRAVRDRGILLLGFATALRRSNLVALDLADLAFQERGIVVSVRKEKQDQLGRGRLIGVPLGEHLGTCPVLAVRAWLACRGSEPGPLFLGPNGRLRPNTIAQIVKRAAKRIALDPRGLAAHSLRAGYVTAAVDRDVNLLKIAATTGHRSLDTLRRYFRRSDPLRACARVGL